MKRAWRTLGASVLAGSMLTACVRMPLSAPQPSLANVQLARVGMVKSVQVGTFALASGLDPALDKGVSARGSSMSSPFNDSMSAYLREVLITELKAAGRFDARSDLTVSGWLTRSELAAGAGASDMGQGALGARFVVKTPTQTLYDRELKVSHQWPSAFMGVEAIPTAFYEYNALMLKLVGQLLADPDFQKSVR